MRILLINPNTSVSVTDRLEAAARRVMGADTVLDCMTATRGVPYISTRSEAMLGGVAVLEILAARHMDYDAAIIAAFGDPGLGAARELYDIPVIGLSEAGMLTACMLGKRFAVLTFAEALGPWYAECVAWHGLEGRCAGIHMLGGGFSSVDAVQEEKADALATRANEITAGNDVDSIVLAGAPLAGLATVLRDRVPVPLVDCAEAAICQAETLVRMRPRPPANGSFRRPGAKASTGLDPALAGRIAHSS